MDVISSVTTYIFFIAIFVNLLFAVVVYLSDRKSATNIVFAILSIAVSVWLVAMYLSLGSHSNDPTYIKLTLFFAVPMNVLFFLFVHTLPSTTLRISRPKFSLLILGTIFMMALSMSPFVFSSTAIINNALQIVPGIGLILFGLFSVVLNFGAIFYVLIKKLRTSAGMAKRQTEYIAVGISLMFGCIIFTIFIPFVFFGNSMLVTFFPLYTLLFLAIAGYAILREGLFNVKVLLTEAAIIVLLIILLARVFLSDTLSQSILDLIVFTSVAIFGAILIQSVRREVEQREELERLNKQIQATNAQLEELSRFKSELLSLASHQIKSPLAAIKGFASLIADGSYGEVSDKTKEALAKIKASADGLIGLINTLLDVRKVEEGKMEYQFAPVDLAELVSQVVTALEPLALAKNLKFDFDFQKKPIIVNADKEKLRQVIQNLTDNSIKYTPTGFVHLALTEEKGVATFSVSDSGVGIPATLIPHLFEEFVRDDRVKKQILGTGLGLYIARKIVEAHAGKIWAESPGEGRGSTFRVSLPEATLQK